MKPDIFKYAPEKEFATGERCCINEMLNQPTDSSCSIARARVLPGVSTQLHAVINTVERYVILAGQGKVEIGDLQAVQVSRLDVVMIPAGVSQKITNTGDDDLIFLCICTPRFEQKNYQILEQS